MTLPSASVESDESIALAAESTSSWPFVQAHTRSDEPSNTSELSFCIE
jgi:hypothetical protein